MKTREELVKAAEDARAAARAAADADRAAAWDHYLAAADALSAYDKENLK